LSLFFFSQDNYFDLARLFLRFFAVAVTALSLYTFSDIRRYKTLFRANRVSVADKDKENENMTLSTVLRDEAESSDDRRKRIKNNRVLL